MPSHHPINFAQLSTRQARQIINDAFIQNTFRKHMSKHRLQKAQQKIPSDSVNYVSNIMQKIVAEATLRPSHKARERQENCQGPKTDANRVKIVRKDNFRNSSIELGHYQENSRHRNSFQFSKSSFKKLCLKVPFSKRTESNNSSTYSIQDRNSTNKTHQRTATLPSMELAPSSFIRMDKQLQPLSSKQHAPTIQRQSIIDSYHNQQLDQHIDLLRYRKLKMQAVFGDFSSNGEYITGKKKVTQADKTQKNNTKTTQKQKKQYDQDHYQTIVTDYDGEIMSTQPAHKLKKITNLNKQNNYKIGCFTPIIRIKTEISTNFLQLQQNLTTFKKSKQQHSRRKLYEPQSTTSHKQRQRQKQKQKQKQTLPTEMTQKQESTCSMEQLEMKRKNFFESQQKKQVTKQKLQTSQLLFTVDDLSKSRRMVQKSEKSNKRVCWEEYKQTEQTDN